VIDNGSSLDDAMAERNSLASESQLAMTLLCCSSPVPYAGKLFRTSFPLSLADEGKVGRKRTSNWLEMNFMLPFEIPAWLPTGQQHKNIPRCGNKLYNMPSDISETDYQMLTIINDTKSSSKTQAILVSYGFTKTIKQPIIFCSKYVNNVSINVAADCLTIQNF